MAKELDNTYLLTDPITGRRVSESCFNGTHDNSVMSLCRAVSCQCYCHNEKPRLVRREKLASDETPISVAKLGALKGL